MAEYGIPYMGSKGTICDELIKIFPKAKNFYDIFGGGFSVTHAMLMRRPKDYLSFHFNEIRPNICDLIQQAINGDFNYDKFKPPWVSREEFFKNLDTDPMIKILWSFGNNGKGYLFSKEIEPYKKSMHMAIVFNEFDDLAIKVMGHNGFKETYSINKKRLFLRNRIEYFRTTKVPKFLWPFLKEKDLAIVKKQGEINHLKQLEQLQQLERLERLEQLERLERLEQTKKLNFYNLSYEQVPIKENSIIYCDPPYEGTAEYSDAFNHKAFFDWADSQANPVFISEYNISDNRFKEVWNIKKRSLLSGNKTLNNKIERVYVNKAGLKYL